MPRNSRPRCPPESAAGELDEAEQSAVRRRWATQGLRLHTICHERACRRARRCVLTEAPCIVRYKRIYQDLLPAFRKELLARL